MDAVIHILIRTLVFYLLMEMSGNSQSLIFHDLAKGGGTWVSSDKEICMSWSTDTNLNSTLLLSSESP